MADTFVVQPKRGDPYKTTDFVQTLGSLFTDGVLIGLLNNFDIDTTLGGLSIKVKTGAAIIDGVYVELSVLSDTKTLTDAATNYIYIELTKNASLRITGAQITINITGTAPSTYSVEVARITTVASAITVNSQAYRQIPVLAYGSTGGAIFGTGGDGDATISTPTTITEIKYYDNLTINDTVTFNFGPSIIYVKGTLTVNSGKVFHANGLGSSGGAGGAGGVPAAGVGSVGSSGASGTIGTNGSPTSGGAGGTASPQTSGAGGNGGASSGGSPGGGAGKSSPTSVIGGAGGSGGTLARKFNNIFEYLAADTRSTAYGAGGGGGAGSHSGGNGGAGAAPGYPPPAGYGGSPGAGGTKSGSPGGAGGGTFVIVAKNIVNNGTISANGGIGGSFGAGGNGGNGGGGGPGGPGGVGGGGGGGGGGSGSVGGGGGGQGGLLIIIYSSLVNNGTISVSGSVGSIGADFGVGGSFGSGGGGSPPGSPGSTGVNGTGVAVTGGTGGNGVIIYQRV